MARLLTKRIIPCLDVDRGRVVKGVNFLNLRDAGDPVEVARRYEAEGADELVFLDITASHEGRDIMLDVVRRVAEQIFMPFTVGVGIRTLEDATRLIQAGELDVGAERPVRLRGCGPRIGLRDEARRMVLRGPGGGPEPHGWPATAPP